MVRYAGDPIPIYRDPKPEPRPEIKQKTFKAKVDMVPYCPECGNKMEMTKPWGKESERLCACKNMKCNLREINFELPEVVIKRYVE